MYACHLASDWSLQFWVVLMTKSEVQRLTWRPKWGPMLRWVVPVALLVPAALVPVGPAVQVAWRMLAVWLAAAVWAPLGGLQVSPVRVVP